MVISMFIHKSSKFYNIENYDCFIFFNHKIRADVDNEIDRDDDGDGCDDDSTDGDGQLLQLEVALTCFRIVQT